MFPDSFEQLLIEARTETVFYLKQIHFAGEEAKMTVKEAKQLAAAFKENNVIKRLSLVDNQLDKDCAILLINALKGSQTIEEIDLAWNHMGDEVAKAIANLIKENSSLKGIDLTGNLISNEGAKAIQKALQEKIDKKLPSSLERIGFIAGSVDTQLDKDIHLKLKKLKQPSHEKTDSRTPLTETLSTSLPTPSLTPSITPTFFTQESSFLLLSAEPSIKPEKTTLAENEKPSSIPTKHEYKLKRQAFDQALIAYYKLDEDASDSSENNLHGHNKGVTFNQKGIEGNAGFFNSKSYIEIPHHHLLDLEDNFTISFWIKQKSFNGSGSRRYIDKTTAGKADGYMVDDYGQVIRFIAGTTNGSMAFAKTSLTLNTWHHIAITYSAGQTIFYLDGNFDGESNDLFEIQKNALSLKIGFGTGTSTEYFHGLMDEIRIYNKLLSDKQIKVLYLGNKEELASESSDFLSLTPTLSSQGSPSPSLSTEPSAKPEKTILPENEKPMPNPTKKPKKTVSEKQSKSDWFTHLIEYMGKKPIVKSVANMIDTSAKIMLTVATVTVTTAAWYIRQRFARRNLPGGAHAQVIDANTIDYNLEYELIEPTANCLSNEVTNSYSTEPSSNFSQLNLISSNAVDEEKLTEAPGNIGNYSLPSTSATSNLMLALVLGKLVSDPFTNKGNNKTKQEKSTPLILTKEEINEVKMCCKTISDECNTLSEANNASKWFLHGLEDLQTDIEKMLDKENYSVEKLAKFESRLAALKEDFLEEPFTNHREPSYLFEEGQPTICIPENSVQQIAPTAPSLRLGKG